VTDMRMPGVDGLKLQQELNKALPHLSIVFITGHGSVPMTVKAMKGGAVDFLEKPVDYEALLTAIHRAADRSRALRASREELVAIERRYGRMTPHERQVFSLVTAGSLNKQIAFDLSVVERTVRAHRARAMKKMEADSLAQLVRMAQLVGMRSRNVPELRALGPLQPRVRRHRNLPRVRSSIFVGAYRQLEITACLLFICGNELLAVKDRPVCARRAIPGRIAEQVAPLVGRPIPPSLPRVNYAQHVAGIKLIRVQTQRSEHLLLRFGQHIAPFVNQAEIVV
jgi:FixJ family two-component response regulator